MQLRNVLLITAVLFSRDMWSSDTLNKINDIKRKHFPNAEHNDKDIAVILSEKIDPFAKKILGLQNQLRKPYFTYENWVHTHAKMKQVGAGATAVGMAMAAWWLIKTGNQQTGDTCGGYLIYALIPGFLSAGFAAAFIEKDFYKGYDKNVPVDLSQEDKDANKVTNQNIHDQSTKCNHLIDELTRNDTVKAFLEMKYEYKQKKASMITELRNLTVNV